MPSSSLTFFHVPYFLVKSLILFIAYITGTIWKSIQMTVELLQFDAHVTTKCRKSSERTLHKFTVVSGLLVPKGNSLQPYKTTATHMSQCCSLNLGNAGLSLVSGFAVHQIYLLPSPCSSQEIFDICSQNTFHLSSLPLHIVSSNQV